MSVDLEIFAISSISVESVSVTGLTALGGPNGSGIVLEKLKHDGDYLILAKQAGGLAVHPLRGSKKQPLVLKVNQSFQVDDLTIALLPKPEVKVSNDGDVIQEVLAQMAAAQDSEKPLGQLLAGIMKVALHEKGLIITKNISDQFEVLMGNNLAADRSWISEKLIQDCVSNQKPTFVNNVIGSTYNSSQSLVSTGFLSVFCWPLMVQGNVIGVLVTGSRRPHAGLSSGDGQRIATLVHLAGMLGNFRLRELGLKREIEQLRSRREDAPFQTQSKSLKQTCDLARQVADSDLSILVQGETGVGKEVMARWLHEKSGRARGPFIAVNCGAIPGELLESLLFGHKKGSFTHAFNDQIGKIQAANGGTLFLDEVGDLPQALQPKLLRVLNDKMVEPIGANRAVQVDVRILTATHKSLKDLVAAKTFRDDLYYRLAEMTLWIPPLRDRATDILLIAANWLNEIAPEKTLADDARRWLMAQPWKGNVRELKSAVKRAVVLSSVREIQLKHLMLGQESEMQARPAIHPELEWLGAENLEKAKQSFVMEKINQALEQTGGNRTRAAQLLGVTPRTLFRYLEEDGKGLSQ